MLGRGFACSRYLLEVANLSSARRAELPRICADMSTTDSKRTAGYYAGIVQEKSKARRRQDQALEAFIVLAFVLTGRVA